MTGHNLTVEVENLRLQRPQLGAESKEAGAGNLRLPFVAYIGDHIEQLFNAIASDRCDDAKLGKMRADRIDHCGLLTDEQMAGAVEHQAALLLDRLGRHEPHVGSRDCFANRLRVRSVVLLPLDVRLHIGRWHQQHRMPQRPQLAQPPQQLQILPPVLAEPEPWIDDQAIRRNARGGGPVEPPDGIHQRVTDLVLKPNGSVAWIAEQTDFGTNSKRRLVPARDTRGARKLDEGAAIELRSLSLTGSTLRWKRNGARTAQLH